MSTCEEVKPELPSFCWGASEAPERELVEAHLPECRECLAEFLAHKRTFEAAAAFDQRPSEAIRARLRSVVAARHQPPATIPLRRRPLVWGLGLAAAAALLLLVLRAGSVPEPRPVPNGGLVDSAAAEVNLTFL